MFSFLSRIIPRKIRSGSIRYPTPVDVFEALLENLLDLALQWDSLFFDGQDKVFLKVKKCRGWIKLHMCQRDIIVDFRFPYSGSLEDICAEKKIIIPGGWKLRRFKTKKNAVFQINQDYKSSIPPFLDSLFKKLYGCPDDYSVVGKLSLGFWQTD